MDIHNTYNKLARDVVVTYRKIEEVVLSKKRGQFRSYGGYQILFSPLIYKPEILFIGINPGNGAGELIRRYKVPKVHDYLKEDYYQLSKQI